MTTNHSAKKAPSAPIAALSQKPRLLFDYFAQLFAQVTNPPLDAIREELVTSLFSQLGPEQNLLDATPAHCRTIVVPFPVLTNDDLAKIVHINDDGEFPGFASHVVRGTFTARDGGKGMLSRLAEIKQEVSRAIENGARLIVLSQRGVDAEHAPIPSLLLTGTVHHHLVRERSRTRVGLVVESADAREVHHIALLLGYGASAVNPYLAMATVEDLAERGDVPGVDGRTAAKNLVKALGKGVRKTMSKMGVSTVASYTGAQIFEALGLVDTVIELGITPNRPDCLSHLGVAREVAAMYDRELKAREELGREPLWEGVDGERAKLAGGAGDEIFRGCGSHGRYPFKLPYSLGMRYGLFQIPTDGWLWKEAVFRDQDTCE